MALDFWNTQIRDTNNYQSQAISATVQDETVIQLVNTHNQSLDYKVEASYDGDDSWSDAVELTSGTISAGGVDSYYMDAPWDKVRVTATASTAPTSGSLVVKGHTS